MYQVEDRKKESHCRNGQGEKVRIRVAEQKSYML